MHDATVAVPPPGNEPVLGYLVGSPERERLTKELARMAGECPEVPAVIGGRRASVAWNLLPCP